MSAKKADDRTFEAEVLESSEPVLVDFWAPWCGPCRAMSDVVEEVATELDPRAKVVKVNIDEASDAASRFGIQSIPSFTVFRGGEAREQLVGVVPKQQLLDLIEPHLN